MTKDGKNLLEIVCADHGLTHNLIIMLWSSKKFSEMPIIKNQKSKSIVEKYIANGAKDISQVMEEMNLNENN